MMLKELTQIARELLPLDEFKAHVLLGSGFSDDGAEDAVLERCLRTAIAAVEGRIEKALLIRDYLYQVKDWTDFSAQVLPLAPVTELTEVALTDHAGTRQVIASEKYMLEEDTHRPRVVATGVILPQIAVGGRAEIRFRAGYGMVWADLPADLSEAVFLLAAHYYENRHATSASGSLMPYGVDSFLDRYRNLRLFGGRA